MWGAVRSTAIAMLAFGVPVLLAAESVVAQPADAGDFRYSRWGDSIDEARRSETAAFHHRSDDELAFTDDSLEGIDGGIVYLFERGRLVTGLYVSRQPYRDGVGVLEDYETLRRHLERRVGHPGRESRRWTDDRESLDPEDLEGELLAAALADDRLRVATEWNLERTRIELLMTGTEEGGVFLRAVFKPSG